MISVTWAATRATGLSSLALLSLVTALGVLTAGGWVTSRWPRTITVGLHVRLTLLAVCMLALHITTTVVDGFVPIGWVSALVPFATTYRPWWVAFGAVGVDLLIAVVATSVLRHRVGPRIFRAVHWLAYGAWACACVHALGVATDTHAAQLVAGAGLAMVGAAAITRLSTPLRARG